MIVLDASVVLAVLLDEVGADVVVAQMRGAELSIVNLSEVLAKSAERGAAPDATLAIVESFQIRIREFRTAHALAAAELRPLTRHRGLSFGDRTCLAHARISKLPVLTADRNWAGLDLGIDIQFMR